MSTDKTCIETGSSVIDMLMEQGLMVGMTEKANLPNDVKIEKIAKHMKEIIETLGYDLSDEELSGTPLRIAKMWVNDWFVAWDPKKFPKCTTFKNKGADSSFTDEMVIVRNINVMSNCAHHFTTTDIKVDVGYVVNSEMIGLSKINRIVKQLSKNPTSQETLGKAIAKAISHVTQSDDVIVRIDGVHYCVKSRGADDQTSSTITLAALGEFSEKGSQLRKEFNQAISLSV